MAITLERRYAIFVQDQVAVMEDFLLECTSTNKEYQSSSRHRGAHPGRRYSTVQIALQGLKTNIYMNVLVSTFAFVCAIPLKLRKGLV